jgi:hypothetical protein
MAIQPIPAARCFPWKGRLITVMVVTAATFALAPTASASPASYKGSSANGEVVFFETDEQLVPGDTDTKRDVYQRSYDAEPGIESYVTREVSLGPAGGNDAYNATFERANDEGTRVFFATEEALVEEDTDHRADVYARDPESGETTLVSRGEAACSPVCGNGGFDGGFAGASSDGEEVFFVTQEKLTAADKDDSVDLYERDVIGKETTLVSVGAAACAPECGNGPYSAALRGVSGDGSHVYFTTEEALVPAADGDSATDVYARDLAGGETTLVSQAGEGCVGCGNGGKVPVFRASSADGSRVFFTTDEKLVGADEDGATDIYARDLPAGPTILVSGGSEVRTASFAAASADGAQVFFTTAESLAPEDEDGANDIYEWNGGALGLVTPAACASECGATFDAVSADSEAVLFSTSEQLSGEDTDGAEDIYAQAVGGGAPVLVSLGTGCGPCGNGGADARFDRASADASHVAFTSLEALSPEDGDSEDDIYARDVSAEETSLVTTSPSFCPLKKGNCGATFVDASVEGARIFFTTVERFTLEDGDNEVDVYERFLGASPSEDVTRLVSTGNSPDLELGPPAPLLESTNPASPGTSTTPKILGKAESGSKIKIYTTSNCSGEPVAHGSAVELAEPGIGVTVKVGETRKFWATAEAEGFVSLCSSPISYTQEDGASPGGDGGGGSVGSTGSGGAKTGGPVTPVLAHVVPHTRITFAPAAKTRSRNPTLRFTDATGQLGTRFSCKVDRHHWKRCSSPLRLKRLSRGRHVVEIRAVNAVGTAEPRPAIRRFKVVPR